MRSFAGTNDEGNKKHQDIEDSRQEKTEDISSFEAKESKELISKK